MTATTGTERLTCEQETQTFLPTQYAGLQLQCPETTAPLARAAHLIENGHHIWDAIRRWADQGLTAAAPERYDGVEGTDFHTLASALDRLNHAFDPNGPQRSGSGPYNRRTCGSRHRANTSSTQQTERSARAGTPNSSTDRGAQRWTALANPSQTSATVK